MRRIGILTTFKGLGGWGVVSDFLCGDEGKSWWMVDETGRT